MLLQTVATGMALLSPAFRSGRRTCIAMRRWSACGSRLETLYGSEIARAVCDLFGGTLWEVPTVKSWRARCLARRGLTDNEIALRCGVNYRSVRRLLRHSERVERRRVAMRDDRQQTLF